MTTTGGGTMSLPMDIIETPTAYELHADTPGMTPEDVKVELHEGVLTVSGNRKVRVLSMERTNALRGCCGAARGRDHRQRKPQGKSIVGRVVHRSMTGGVY